MKPTNLEAQMSASRTAPPSDWKKRLKANLPGPVQGLAVSVWRQWRALLERRRLLSDSRYDRQRYARHSHTLGVKGEPKLKALLIKQYHGVEKGLSLTQPRPAFGRAKIENLMATVETYLSVYGPDPMVDAALDSLESYRRFSESAGAPVPWLVPWLELQNRAAGRDGGVTPITKAEIEAAIAEGAEAFFASRHSVRQYAPGEVPLSDIERAVRMAQKTPSVCNRQGGRVHCFANAQEALKWQPGNGGFGHLASRALVITTDLSIFGGSGERNQAFVDGGLFAMSVMYALHALGYGSCPLAWAASAERDREMRRALNIPDNEAVMMFISVGRLPDQLNVARSFRRPLSEVLTIHGG